MEIFRTSSSTNTQNWNWIEIDLLRKVFVSGNRKSNYIANKNLF